MRCFIGIDLGSTTTKAVVMDEDQNILGRGITNSRSNYDTAAAIAKQEALVNSRFHLFREALGSTNALNGSLDAFLGQLERDFRSEQYLEQLGDLDEHLPAQPRDGEVRRRHGRRGRDARRGVPAPHRRSADPVRARREAQVGLLPRHRRQPVPRHRRDRGQGIGHPLRLPAQRLRPLDHRGREPRLRRLDPAPPARRARAHLHGAARDGVATRAGRSADQGHPRHRDGRDLRRRHRLRPGAAAVLQGARPLGDPVPRARRARDVSATRPRCSTSAARTPRRSRSTRTASSRASR